MTFPTNQNSSKSSSKLTGIAFKSTKEEDDESSSDDEISLADFEEQLARITKKFRRKFWKNRTDGSSSTKPSKGSSGSKSSKLKSIAKPSKEKEKDDFEGEIRCYRCKGYGHISTDCPSPKLYKKKALQAKTWDDSSFDESTSSEEEKEQFVAFHASQTPSSNLCLASLITDSIPLILHETSTSGGESSSEGESDEEELIEAYQQLLAESKKMAKLNKKLRKQRQEVQDENQALKIKLHDLEEEHGRVLDNNRILQEKLNQSETNAKSYMDKVGFLEKQFEETHVTNQALTKQVHELKSNIQRLSIDSKKLDCMFGLGQSSKVGLGFKKNQTVHASSSTKKLNGRTCYLCGLEGHLVKVCPKKRKKNPSATSSTERTQRNQKTYQVKGVHSTHQRSEPQHQSFKWITARQRPKVDQQSKLPTPGHNESRQPKIQRFWIRKGDIFPCLKF